MPVLHGLVASEKLLPRVCSQQWPAAVTEAEQEVAEEVGRLLGLAEAQVETG